MEECIQTKALEKALEKFMYSTSPYNILGYKRQPASSYSCHRIEPHPTVVCAEAQRSTVLLRAVSFPLPTVEWGLRRIGPNRDRSLLFTARRGHRRVLGVASLPFVILCGDISRGQRD
jgi:hypothetical protein